MEKQTAIKKPAKNLNKPAYIIFLAAGIGFLVTKDLSQAVVFWGLALVFDPFNINQPFQKKTVVPAMLADSTSCHYPCAFCFTANGKIKFLLQNRLYC